MNRRPCASHRIVLDVVPGMDAGRWPGWGSARRGGVVRREFERFVAAATDRLFRLGYLMTFDAAETEELVQETLWRTARRWDEVDVRGQPVSCARRTLVQLVLDRSSRRTRRRGASGARSVAEDAAPEETSIRVLRGVDEAAEFRWALALLEPEQRAAVVLRYYEEISETEAAEALGCPVGEVAALASHGTARLRRMLGRRPLDGRRLAAPSTGHPS